MVAAALWLTSSVGVPALGAAPFPVSGSVAIGARVASAFTLAFSAVREFRDLVIRALVKTVSVDLHEPIFDGLQAPTFSGEAGPRRASSLFEATRGFHVLGNRKLEHRSEISQKRAQSAEFGPSSGELSRGNIAQIS